jgi:hypothetical protein
MTGRMPPLAMNSNSCPAAVLSKKATRHVTSKLLSTEKIRLGECAVKKWLETMRILVTCESPGTV